WLAEDVPYGDLTTHALGIGNHHGRITFEARQAMVAACSEEAGRIMALAGADVMECVPSGTALQTGGLLLAAQGPAAALHAGWKVAQTLLETARGIAAAAQAIVQAAQQVNSDVVVACTRKSLPGARALSIKAILSGGAVPPGPVPKEGSYYRMSDVRWLCEVAHTWGRNTRGTLPVRGLTIGGDHVRRRRRAALRFLQAWPRHR